jgi:diguanylate cyclase (GGDEF)-like protein
MPVHQFSLLVQAAGTVLLLLVFVLLYRKIRRPAFLDWIASWTLLFAGLTLLWVVPYLKSERAFYFLLHVCLLAHVALLLRGLRRFRNEKAGSSALELLWAVPILGTAWWTALVMDPEAGRGSPIAFVLAGAYAVTALFFTVTPGSPAGRLLLSFAFLVWGAERAVWGWASLRFGSLEAMPDLLQYSNFLDMFLEMMIAVGIIILLFEAGQGELAAEMEQLIHSEHKLKEMGVRDPLTGLYNRNFFNDVIRRELANSRRYGSPLSVLLADVDRFKEINDVKGHAAGDEVLKFVAAYLISCVRDSDYVFRWGGDEFLVLLTRTDETGGAQKAEELARRLPSIPGTDKLSPSLSVGWATHRNEVEFPKTLAEADARMYETKLRGKKERAAKELDR